MKNDHSNSLAAAAAAHKTTTRRARGFSLLETLISTLVVTIVMGSVLTVIFRSQIFAAEEMQGYKVEQTGRRVAYRISEELKGAAQSSVSPIVMDDSNFVTFQRPVDFEAGTIRLGPAITISFELEQGEGEAPDGIDNNGDGRADEGVVVYSEAGDEPVTIGADIVGLRFNRLGNSISFELDVATLNRDGIVVQKTFAQAVAFRN